MLYLTKVCVNCELPTLQQKYSCSLLSLKEPSGFLVIVNSFYYFAWCVMTYESSWHIVVCCTLCNYLTGGSTVQCKKRLTCNPHCSQASSQSHVFCQVLMVIHTKCDLTTGSLPCTSTTRQHIRKGAPTCSAMESVYDLSPQLLWGSSIAAIRSAQLHLVSSATKISQLSCCN